MRNVRPEGLVPPEISFCVRLHIDERVGSSRSEVNIAPRFLQASRGIYETAGVYAWFYAATRYFDTADVGS